MTRPPAKPYDIAVFKEPRGHHGPYGQEYGLYPGWRDLVTKCFKRPVDLSTKGYWWFVKLRRIRQPLPAWWFVFVTKQTKMTKLERR